MLIRNFPIFFIVVTLDMLAFTASMAAEGALNRRVGGEEATRFRASLRAVANLGVCFGSVGCGIAVQIDTPTSYRALIITNALTFLVGAALVSRLPHYEPLPKEASGPTSPDSMRELRPRRSLAARLSCCAAVVRAELVAAVFGRLGFGLGLGRSEWGVERGSRVVETGAEVVDVGDDLE